ncbi:MAG TPA: hypothetical protein VLZ89_14980 [Anaerolineales bacterium]|nr:hypothetical protein [Anaerolineales bacterium]
MDTPEPIQLDLEITIPDATEEELDALTRQLLLELRQTDVEAAELRKGGTAPAGSKGDPVTIGSIALVVLPAVLPKILDLIQSWSGRGQGRTVKFIGKGINFEGSPEDLLKVLRALEKGRKK